MVSKFKRLKKSRRGRPAGSVFKVRDIQAKRSLRAKAIDARLKARLAKNVQEWAKQPNRRDLKGVDYPKERKGRTPSETYKELQQSKNHFAIELREKPVGYTFSVPKGIGADSLSGTWERVNVGGDPFLRNVDSGKYKASSSFFVVSGSIKEQKPRVYKVRFSYLTGDGERKTKTWKIDSTSEKKARESAERIFRREYKVERAKPKILEITTTQKAKPKVHYEVIVGETVKSGSSASSLSHAEEQMKKLRQEKPTLRQMKIVKIEDGKFTDVKTEKQQIPRMGGAVSYNKATGWMRLSFPDKPPKEIREEMKSHGFRYKPRSKTWSGKWTPERQDFSEALVGKMTTVDIKPNWAKKATNAAVMAQKHEGKSDEAYDRAHKKLSAIPFGQPILVGHHSEKRHRSDLRKINRLEKKGREESDIAEKYQRRAKRYGRKATGEDPVTIHNRIKRLEADERKLSKRKDEHGKRWLAHTQERLRIEREKYKASGGIALDKITIKLGDRVKTRFGKGTVATISKNTLRVKLDSKVGIYANQRGESKLDKTDIYGKLE